jgi:hypothetical protein
MKLFAQHWAHGHNSQKGTYTQPWQKRSQLLFLRQVCKEFNAHNGKCKANAIGQGEHTAHCLLGRIAGCEG